MTDVRVVEVAPDAKWDAWVRACKDSGFWHLGGWSHIVHDVLGREYRALAATTQSGEWLGVMPLVRMKAPMLGHTLISMPYLNYGGAIGTTEARAALVAAAVAEAKASGADRVQIRSRTPTPGGLRELQHKILVMLDLPPEPDMLWKSFPAKLRSQIRRPEKENMIVRFGADQVDAFYSVFSRNMRDLGTPVYSRSFFRAIAETFSEAVVGVVYHGDVAVAAGFGFLYASEYEMTWASANRDYNALSPNMLLYWSFMREMIRRGATLFNFGRSTPDTGTHRFKKQWGGRDEPLPWVEWNATPVAGSSGPSRVFHLASDMWKRLPVAVANMVGPPIAARLPWW